jgi:hypothetical protein
MQTAALHLGMKWMNLPGKLRHSAVQPLYQADVVSMFALLLSISFDF